MFNYEMLTLARKTRRKTQGQLAKETGISQSVISKCEAGLRIPDDNALEQFAIALDYPIRFFGENTILEGPGTNEFFHRKRKAMNASSLNKVYALAEVRRIEIMKLLRSTGEYDPIPIMPIDEYDDDPCKIARTVRAHWNLPNGPIENITRTVERNGCIVVGHPFDIRHIDGFSYHAHGIPPIFHLNTMRPSDRWRWTIAHELGHIIMHGNAHDYNDCPLSDIEVEQQANKFAGEFLAPKHELLPMMAWNLDLPRLASLKREWKISMQALVMRAYEFGIINARKKQGFFILLSKAGYRVNEPLELAPPVETPESLFKMAKFHLTHLQYSREELLDFLTIGEADFQQYYSDPYDTIVAHTSATTC